MNIRTNYIDVILLYHGFLDLLESYEFIDDVDCDYASLAPELIRKQIQSVINYYDWHDDDAMPDDIQDQIRRMQIPLGRVLGWSLKDMSVKKRCESCVGSEVSEGGVLQCITKAKPSLGQLPLPCARHKNCKLRELEALETAVEA